MEKIDLSNISINSLLQELSHRDYNILDSFNDEELYDELNDRSFQFPRFYSDIYDFSDKELTEELKDRGIDLSGLETLLDNVYILYKSYICKDSNFDDNLKKFFSKSLNINVL